MNEELLKTWNELNTRLFNFINQKVNNPEIAKDINQDVFIKVFSKIDSLRDKDKIVSWIYQITRNEINTFFRKKEPHQKAILADKTEILDENLTTEFSKCILPMIEALPLKYQEAIRMTEIEGLSQKELATSVNISYSGAKSRVQRGRKMLKTLLQECCTISTDKYGNITDYKEKKCNKNCG